MWPASLSEGIVAWYQRQSAMWALRAMQRRDAPLAPIRVSQLLQFVRNGALSGDVAGTMKSWTELRQQYPDYAMTSREAILSLLDLKLYDEADDILAKSVKKYRGLPKLMELWAEVAQRRGDYVEANRRWSVVRAKFPHLPRAYAMGAASLKHLGRIDEAKALLEEAVRIDPTDFIAITEYATLAAECGDWPEALRRWTLVKERFETPRAWLETAACLRELGRLDEAVDLLKEACWRFQNDYRAPLELAWLPHRRGDWPAAIHQWQHLREVFPQVPAGYIAGARALRAAGRPDEAETLLLVAIDRIQNVSSEPLVEYARFAHERGDWPEAIRRWEAVRERLPERRVGYSSGSEALEAAGRHQEAIELRAAGAALPG